MPEKNLSESKIAAARESIHNLLGLDLSDDEIKASLAGETISFEKLLENRSLSEIGMALIQADAVHRFASSGEDAEKVCIEIMGRQVCLPRPDRLPLSES